MISTPTVPEAAFDLPVRPSVRALKPSATLAINERSKALARDGRQIFKLGFGQSPFPVPPLVVDALRSNAAQKDYLPAKGLPELRDAVADFHRRRHGLDVKPEDVFIGPGSKELMFILQLMWDGDVILPSPSWVSYEPQGRLLGRRVHWIPTSIDDGWRLTPEALSKFCTSAGTSPLLLILNYPSNPTGVTYTETQLKELAETARRFRLVVLSDEIYGELTYVGPHSSLARHYPEGTIVSSGLSKWCGAGGWRLGTFCFPARLRELSDLMAVVASETFSAVSAPIQHAAVTAFRPDPRIDEYLEGARKVLRAVGSYVGQALNAASIRTVLPEGGFYVFPEFASYASRLERRGIRDSYSLCDQLLKDTGVALLPGTDFGRPAKEFSARLAFVDFDGEQCLNDALDQRTIDETYIRTNCGRVVEGVERLVDWLGSD